MPARGSSPPCAAATRAATEYVARMCRLLLHSSGSIMCARSPRASHAWRSISYTGMGG